jgi:Peptidase family M28
MPHLPQRSSRGLLISLAFLALVFVLTITQYRPPAPTPADAPAAEFSAVRAQETLRQLVGDGVPHPVGSAADGILREKIVRILSDLGYQPQIQSGFACDEWGVCGAVKNVVARIDGAAVPGAVLVSAHYDSVPAGPGASDDGVGTVAVLEIARALKNRPPLRHPVIILLNEGEEAGLLGAKAFVEAHPWAHEVKAAVNLDNRGSSGISQMFETGDANDWAVRIYDGAISRPMTNSISYMAYKLLPNDTDFTVYKAAGYQGLNFAFIGNVQNYHTPHDNFKNADPRSLQQEGENGLASVLALADEVLTSPPPGEAVYFDIFGRAIVRWKASRSFAISVVLSIFLLIEVVIVIRRFAVGVGTMALGVIGWLGAILISGGLAYALFKLLRLAHRFPPESAQYSWIAHPLAAQIAFFAVGFAGVGVVALLIAKRAGFWGFWIVNYIFFAALGVVTAKLATGACYIFIVPTLGALVAAIPAMLATEDSQGQKEFAAILPAALTFVMFVPLLWQLYEALGTVFLPAVAALFALALAGILPLLALDTPRERRAFAEDSIAVALVAAVVALFMAPYSAASPERVNIQHWLDADAHAAKWVASPDSRRLPAPLAAAAGFSEKRTAVFPWSPERRYAADAPDLKLPPPELTILSAQAIGGKTRYDIKLSSPRGAPVMSLVFPVSAGTTAIEVAGHALEEPSGRVLQYLQSVVPDWRFCEIPTVDAAGVEMKFTIASTSPVEIYVGDKSFSLPTEGLPIAAARPADTIASQDGDVTLVTRLVKLEPSVPLPGAKAHR